MNPSLQLYEDDHLLVVNKPPGWNTHSPSPFGGEGIYDWLRHREPPWGGLSILHRLDKETSGVLVFGKTTEANRSLTRQFTEQTVRKRYLLLIDRVITKDLWTTKSFIVKAGTKHVSSTGKGTAQGKGRPAVTRFEVIRRDGGLTWVAAEPLTGRTHQIRVHMADGAVPILGDTLYGGSAFHRLCLHAERISFRHPVTEKPLSFEAPADFETDPRFQLRGALIDPGRDNAYRLVHGAADGFAGWYVERLGEYLLSESAQPLSAAQQEYLGHWMKQMGLRGVYHKVLTRHIRRASLAVASPQCILGEPASDEIVVKENGLEFALRFSEGYSVGLFLDQRDNRRRFLVNYVAAGFPVFSSGLTGKTVLNTFAYTCAFSVAAAKAGASITSLDLSRKYLEWGKRNFSLNGLDPAGHDFIYGDTFDWLRRLGKKERRFDGIILDPPTFSRSKTSGDFQAAKHYGRLVTAALPLLNPNGVMLASTNAAQLKPEKWLEQITDAVEGSGRRVLVRHYVPQPPDFPVTRTEPAYLKTVWIRVG